MADSWSGAGNIQGEPSASLVSESKELLKQINNNSSSSKEYHKMRVFQPMSKAGII